MIILYKIVLIYYRNFFKYININEIFIKTIEFNAYF